MAKVTTTRPGSAPWVTRAPGGSELDWIEIPPDDENVGGKRTFHPGPNDDPHGLELFEVRLAPDRTIESHAHESDEIIYVLSGQMHLGATVLEAGSTVHVPGRTLYTFKAGPQGLHFLNFRPRPDRSYLTRKEVAATLATRRGEAV
jgi:quercetin dioxygenase-like cupin family protein